jgi:hypothetical protein
MKYIKTLPILFIIALTTACGGGSDSSSGTTNTPSNNNPPASANGEFKRAQNTGRYFGFSQSVHAENRFSDDFNFGATTCVQEYDNYYYETDSALIYGDSTLPNSDFTRVASWIEAEKQNVASLFGFASINDLLEMRNDVAPAALRIVYDSYYLETFTSIDYPDNFDTMDFNQQSAWFARYFRALPKPDQNSIIDEILSSMNLSWSLEDYRLNDKLLVCINKNASDNEYAHGGRYGVSIAAPSVNSRSDAPQIIRHELIHTAQRSLYDSYHSSTLLPRWFIEGQAVFLSGQDIANSRSANYKSPTFVNFSDESNVDFGEVYRHYGLAYKYLQDNNSLADMINIISNMDDSDFNHPGTASFIEPALLNGVQYNFNDGNTSHHPAFIFGFDNANLNDDEGVNLRLERFKRDYDILVD